MKAQLLLGFLALSGLLAAADEDAMFGGEATGSSAPSASTSPTPGSPTSVRPTPGLSAGPSPKGEGLGIDERGLGSELGDDVFSRGDALADPLAIGGVLYQRLSVPFERGLTEGEQAFNLPLQIDAYLDGRPNDRVRAYVGARLLYDSSKDAYGRSTAGTGGGFAVPGGVTTTPLPNNPQVVLDQAWLKFDLARTAFFSLGKQHVKWGTGRIWNPSDALSPTRRDPLQPYDLRLGSNMLSVQLPWEARQANLYAIALFDNPQPASTLQQVGGAIRLEAVVGPAELGLSAVGRAGTLPRYGADLSTPLGPFDAHVEAAFLSNDGSLGHYQWLGLPASLSPTPTLQSLYAFNKLPAAALQIVGGLDYSFNWRPNRTATIGAEYFYNELGVSDGELYPILLYLNQFTPFYLGKHYAALFIRAEGPDSGNKSAYTLSTIANLNDRSAVSRLDLSWLLLEYLSFGAYVSANYGGSGGEFNFKLDTPALMDGTTSIPPIRYAGTNGEAGMSLRVGF